MIAKIQEKNILNRLMLYKSAFLNGPEKKLAAWATIDDYDSVLDMYCDSERLLSYIGSKYRIRACGICSNCEQAEIIRNRMSDAEIIYGKGDNIPWRDNSFDVAICSQLPENISCVDMIIKDALRVIKPGGQFVAACSWRPKGFSRFRELIEYGHEPLMDAHQLLLLMEKAGYRESSMRIAGINYGIIIGWKAAL